METFIGFLIVLLIVLNGLDAYTTIKVISEGRGREANPVMRFLIDKLGVYAALIGTKVIILGWMIWHINTYNIYGSSIYMLAGIDAVYLYVVINNFKILNRNRL